mgnify:CR=1 FL=1
MVREVQKIIKNSIQCNYCGDIIESLHRHDLKWCRCGTVAVDGGKSYLKRSFKFSPDDFTELSDVEEMTEQPMTIIRK